MLLGGIVGAMIICGFHEKDWAGAVLGFGWARAIAKSLAAMPALETLVAAMALTVVLFLLGWVGEFRALSSEEGRLAVREARRGINGELPRLFAPVAVFLMAITGFAEELLFRFVFMNALVLLLTPFVPTALAVFAAVVVSSFVFWLAHVRYRDFWSSSVVLVLAIVLGAAYAVTGSLAVAALAHAGYNIVEVMTERVKMARDPAYFGGAAPRRVLLDAMEHARSDGDKEDEDSLP